MPTVELHRFGGLDDGYIPPTIMIASLSPALSLRKDTEIRGAHQR